MNTEIVKMHNAIQLFEAMDCWGLAESMRIILLEYMNDLDELKKRDFYE